MSLTAEEILEMTPRQFFNGLQGRYEYDQQMLEAERNLLFSGFRFNASSIGAGLSKELHSHLSKYKFPWEQNQESLKVEGSNFISYDKVKGSLDLISKEENSSQTTQK